MKKNLLLFLFLGLFSCSEKAGEFPVNEPPQSPPNRSYIKYGKINADDAMTIALNAPADFFGEELTKAEPLHIGEVIPVLRGQDEANVPEDTLLHLQLQR